MKELNIPILYTEEEDLHYWKVQRCTECGFAETEYEEKIEERPYYRAGCRRRIRCALLDNKVVRGYDGALKKRRNKCPIECGKHKVKLHEISLTGEELKQVKNKFFSIDMILPSQNISRGDKLRFTFREDGVYKKIKYLYTVIDVNTTTSNVKLFRETVPTDLSDNVLWTLEDNVEMNEWNGKLVKSGIVQ